MGFLDLYFKVPANHKAHTNNMVIVSGYAAHVLIIVGAVTSLPALLSASMWLWSAIFGIDGAGWWVSGSLSVICSFLVLFLVDMKLAALTPYCFKGVGRLATRSIPKTAAEKASTISSLIICCTLAAFSMLFSYYGSAAVVDNYFSHDTGEYHAEILKTNSQKVMELNAITEKWEKDIEQARQNDSENKNALAKQGAKLIATAKANFLLKYGETAATTHRSKYAEIIAKAKQDSTTLSATFIPTVQTLEAKANAEYHHTSAAYAASSEELEKKLQKEASSQAHKAKAVFMITGGLGTIATVLGLLFLAFQTLLSWKPEAVQQANLSPSELKEKITSIRDNISARVSKYKTDGSESHIAAVKMKISELEQLDPDEAKALRIRLSGVFNKNSN